MDNISRDEVFYSYDIDIDEKHELLSANAAVSTESSKCGKLKDQSGSNIQEYVQLLDSEIKDLYEKVEKSNEIIDEVNKELLLTQKQFIINDDLNTLYKEGRCGSSWTIIVSIVFLILIVGVALILVVAVTNSNSNCSSDQEHCLHHQ